MKKLFLFILALTAMGGCQATNTITPAKTEMSSIQSQQAQKRTLHQSFHVEIYPVTQPVVEDK